MQAIWLAAFVLTASAPVVAETWSGALVNSKCYEALENNKNPHDTQSAVNRDRGAEIRYCSPNAKTKSFAIVDEDGYTFQFDAAGDAQAADLVRKTGKRSVWLVDITGSLERNRIRIDSISLAP